jgi:hypothetical protein
LETLFPNITFFPVISQVLDITHKFFVTCKTNVFKLNKKINLSVNNFINEELK